MFSIDINWAQILSHLYHLAIAYILALPIGWDRETSRRRFGLRTFPLVALAACGFMLTGIYVLDTSGAEGRVLQGIITGIGFIGGGAILKGDSTVKGTATAASIWNTGAIGIAVAYSRLEIAIILSLLNFFTLRLVGEVKEKVTSHYGDESI
jgi:putative Mg2+ transporter-C (MgtC) family protein